jgi:hypothetical protein
MVPGLLLMPVCSPIALALVWLGGWFFVGLILLAVVLMVI